MTYSCGCLACAFSFRVRRRPSWPRFYLPSSGLRRGGGGGLLRFRHSGGCLGLGSCRSARLLHHQCQINKLVDLNRVQYTLGGVDFFSAGFFSAAGFFSVDLAAADSFFTSFTVPEGPMWRSAFGLGCRHIKSNSHKHNVTPATTRNT